ncbi:MAG TPA: MerR family transcriptional regulator [Candidatus Dormibacteraeota bacterium]|jgi:DNA-binding transcriptional MerR regulator|nr:MerR family transcriptional regulator [Candidatus Dormibacteraeota bacterium]
MIATLSIAEAARDRRLSPHTLRYYERAGLLDAVPRDRGGRRRYTEADLERVLFLQRMRRTGMPIRVLREYVALVRQGDSSAARRLEMLENHRADVLLRLAELQDALTALDYKIARYREETA